MFRSLFTFLMALLAFGLAQTAEVVLTAGHTDMLSSAAFDPSGKILATGSLDKNVKLWDVPTGLEIRTLGGFAGRIVKVKFDPSGKYLLALDYNENLKVFDVATGKVLCHYLADETCESADFCLGGSRIVFREEEHDDLVIAAFMSTEPPVKVPVESVGRFVVSGDGKRLFSSDINGNILCIDLEKKLEIGRLKIADEYVFMPADMVLNKAGNRLVVPMKDNSLRIYDATTLSFLRTLTGHTSKVTGIAFHPVTGRLVASDFGRWVMEWDVEAGKVYRKTQVPWMFYVNCVALHPNAELAVLGENKCGHYVSLASNLIEVRKFESKGDRIVSLAVDPVHRLLATATAHTNMEISIWNLEATRLERTVKGMFPIAYAPNGSFFACMDYTLDILILDPLTGEKIRTLPSEKMLPVRLAVSTSGKWIASGCADGTVKLYDAATGKLLRKSKPLGVMVTSLNFSPDETMLAVTTTNPQFQILKTSDLSTVFEHGDFITMCSDVAFSPDSRKLAVSSWDKFVNLYDLESGEMYGQLTGHISIITSVAWSADGRYIISSGGNSTVTDADNSIRIWNAETMQQLCIFKNPTGAINELFLDGSRPLVYSSSDDGIARVFDLAECKNLAGFIAAGPQDFMIFTPDNYYLASRDALKTVGFRVGAKVFPFEQFDLVYNRPDIVLSRLGFASKMLVNAYEKAWQKRMSKLNIQVSSTGNLAGTPVVSITSTLPESQVTTRSLNLTVKATDPAETLNRIMVYINDVPVFGTGGISVISDNSKTVERQVSLTLTSGKNKVQVSAINNKGIESLRETFEVYCMIQAPKPTVYLVSIGVSEYKDTRFNLTYASKDAQDVAALLAMGTGTRFGGVKQLVLTNANATKANIMAIGNHLKQATVDDIIIVFMAGHGVLDANLNYYFGNHDLNFNDPATTGVAYEQVEAILDGLAALRKLLIMDTCHSGEVDKEDVTITMNKQTETGKVTFRSTGVDVSYNSGLGLENSFLLMQNLFADLRRGTGATVISSAGGAEYALEGTTWKNGVFTYALLNGLKNGTADLNKDGKVTVSELRGYTGQQVSFLTGGKQQPTTRTENLSNDFVLW